MMLCEHYYCRCMRAEELAQIADRTGSARYLIDAIGVHSQRVTCRLEPLWQRVLPSGGSSAGDGGRAASLASGNATEAPKEVPR